MQPLPAAVTSLITSRIGLALQTLVWITATNRATGADETMGLWSGEIDTTITVDGQARLYYGAGGLISLEPVIAAAGLEVQTLRLDLTPLAPEIEMLIRGYEPRLAAAEVHRLIINPRTRVPAGPPSRRWKGWLDEIEIVSPGEDEPGRISATIASDAMAGSRTLALKRSDESQKLRQIPGAGPDRFARYTDVSGKIPVKWGEA